MTDLKKAAQQALEAWEYINKYGFVLADYEGPMEQAITALRAALEQPEHETAAELRRLHVVNQQLLEVLDEIAADHAYWPDIEKQIRAAIARAEEQA
jgi:hypothetical protein